VSALAIVFCIGKLLSVTLVILILKIKIVPSLDNRQVWFFTSTSLGHDQTKQQCTQVSAKKDRDESKTILSLLTHHQNKYNVLDGLKGK
jgi:hypothetical protein